MLTPAERTEISVDFGVVIDEARYVFVCFRQNPAVQLWTSQQRITGVLAAANKWNRAVSNFGRQDAPQDVDLGIESFEFWTPERRPLGHNFALTCTPPLVGFAAANIANGIARPTAAPNAWVAALDDPQPAVTLTWDQPQTIETIELSFDTDFDHPMESVLMTHPERAMPCCVQAFRVYVDGREIAMFSDNHQTRRRISLSQPLPVRTLVIEVIAMNGNVPAALCEVRCYGLGYKR